MTGPSIQDRTGEFQAILGQAQKRMASSKMGSQRQNLLSETQRRQANGYEDGNAPGGKRSRSEFARKAAEIGRGITATTAKLQRLAECECRLQTRSVIYRVFSNRSLAKWRNERPSLTTNPSRSRN